MEQEQKSNDRTHANLRVRFIATCKRFMVMAQVLHDTVRPWLASGRAKEIIESSNANAEAATEICSRLLSSLNVAHTVLKTNSTALFEYREWCDQVIQSPGNYVGPRLQDLSQELLSLVAKGAWETADLIPPFLECPSQWWGIQKPANCQLVREAVLKSVDVARWQIIKEFTRLVSIFDDHCDPDPDEPCEARERDFQAMLTADLEDW